MSTNGKRVYRFGSDVVDGDGSMTAILGGKGAGLAEMTSLGIPVPPGFTLTTDVCRLFLDQGVLPSGVSAEVERTIHWLEAQSGKRLGDAQDPLLVSVRSGAPVSMPGMMDTVLNIGLNDDTLPALAARSGSEIFALDSYKRLLQMFGSIVLDVPKSVFEAAMEGVTGVKHFTNADAKANPDIASSSARMREVIAAFQQVILQHTGKPFPQDPRVQVTMAIEAVFHSWHTPRARSYRQIHDISESTGTAVTVQTMVFGNHGPDSGTGVGFTRNPSTGERAVFGEYLADAQGEDIVAGTATPIPLAALAGQMPDVSAELMQVAARLEAYFRDVQDFEFTVEKGRLFLLQTRSAQRSAIAAVKIAFDLAEEGIISRDEAIRRIRPSSLADILTPQFDRVALANPPLTSGLAASPGAAVGQIALTAGQAVAMKAQGKAVILITTETTADDIDGMNAAVGFLTARGGATSHAAVVARGMGKSCITGAHEICINAKARTVQVGATTLQEGDWLSIDGGTGEVFAGRAPLRPPNAECAELAQLMGWARERMPFRVRANADTPADALAAMAQGATGIGLCRTEHMFFAAERLSHVQRMIVADTIEERIAALDVLLPMQQSDFEDLFRTMSPSPVTIRLLDPPLHEFLPSTVEIEAQIACARADENWDVCKSLEAVRRKIDALTEVNPMMGHRGCRLSLTFPEILQMQVRAILQAALRVAAEGAHPSPEIMVPLVASEAEMRVLAEMIQATAKEVFAEHTATIAFRIGAMIELPRAAICAAQIASHVSFISFGTNDLTQMTFGFSRDDSASYISSYLEQGLLKTDPFVTIDREGVGKLMEMAIASVRAVDRSIKIGVCGEHAGDPESIAFFQTLGVDYISCSPSRLRVAQLAAAQSSPVCAAAPAFEVSAHSRVIPTQVAVSSRSRAWASHVPLARQPLF